MNVEIQEKVRKGFKKSDVALIESFLTMAKLKDWEVVLLDEFYMLTKGQIRLKMILDVYGKYKGKHRSYVRFNILNIDTCRVININNIGTLTNEESIQKAVEIL